MWKTIQLNEKDVQLSLETARSSKIDMVSQVKQAYYSLLLARDAFSALQASFNTAELNAKNIQTKFEMGKVSEYDRLVADVQYRNIRPQLVSSENAVKLATMQIKVLMGVDVDEPLIFTGSLSDY